MSEFVIANKSDLVDIADAIRAKTEITDTLALSEMPQMIADIQTGTDTSVVTATPSDVLSPKVFIDSEGVEQIGTMPTATQVTPNITVSSAGLITASATQTAGYVVAGTKSATKQLTVQAAKTITPSSSSQTAVAKDRYTTGAVTVAAIPSSYTQLDFNIVGNTSQPSNPAENTLWVNTSTAITSWVFSATQPTGSAGAVWFQTSTSSSLTFNALKENNVTVYPTGCKQYVSGAWVDKTLKAYQNGAWVALVTDITVVPNTSYSWSVIKHQSVSVGSDGTVTFVAGTRNEEHGLARVDTKIDLTDYKSMVVTYKTTTGWNLARIGVLMDTVTDAYSFLAYAGIDGTTNTQITKTIDISEVTGKHNIGVCEYNGTVTIYSIVLKM